ncbi:MAG: fimbria/pilus outer membrane usher protein [Pseudohongiella sp.]|nr:fimbria/pilus outer membrane usher protein [Pseudohongiella sp.]
MLRIIVRNLKPNLAACFLAIIAGYAHAQVETVIAETILVPLRPDRTVILAVTVNGLAGDSGALFLQDSAGKLFATAEFLSAWNLRPGGTLLLASDGTEYFELPGTDGFVYRWDHARSELFIDAISEQFLTNTVLIENDLYAALPYKTGGYLNYDLTHSLSSAVNLDAAHIDAALFAGKNLLTSNQIINAKGSKRLMTSWQRDKIGAMKTLRVGDSYNNTSAWGRSFLFAGIQYGTNFSVRPDFIPFATPVVAGTALLPSSVDIYVDNVLRSSSVVSAGPFQIQNVPIVNGSGDMQIVVNDVLGREQLISQPFFSSPVLLREGQVDEAFEIGWLREDFGLSSNHYGDAFLAATYRRGLSSTLSAELSAELQKDLLAAGFSGAAKLDSLNSVVEYSIALSNAKVAGHGAMSSLRLSYLGHRWSASARAQIYTRRFRQLGSREGLLPNQILSAHISAPLGDGTLSANFVARSFHGEQPTRIMNVSYSQKINRSNSISFSIIRPLSATGETVVALSLVAFMGSNHVGSISVDRLSGATSVKTDLRSVTPQRVGTGYRVATTTGNVDKRQELSINSDQTFGAFQVDMVRLGDNVSARLNAVGSIATLMDGAYFARGLDQGFAVVETGKVSGVPVLLENQIVAYTNSRGRALVSNLRSYQRNHISIDPLSLPLDMSIGPVSQIVVPRARGGLLVDFPVLNSRGIVLAVVLADGTPLPPWTTVDVVGVNETFVTGNRGEVFVELPNLISNIVFAHLPDGTVCQFEVNQPAIDAIAPLSGPIKCLLTR